MDIMISAKDLLSEKYQKLYGYLVEYCKEHHGAFPSLHQVIRDGHFLSTASASYAMRYLVTHKLLDIDKETRSYFIVGGEWRMKDGRTDLPTSG